MHDLSSMTFCEMEEFFCSELGEKKYRALQVYEWLNKRFASSFDEMNNLPKELRRRLSEECRIVRASIREKRVSRDLTTKYLFELEKDTIIESVLMRYSYGNSVCVSTQAGCRMGCVFCMSAVGGLARNLTAGEICAQVYGMNERVSRIVVMGGGEPFDNYGNLLKFLKIITSGQGLNIGARHITVSTCGLADKIHKLAGEGMQINLAVSLHAPNDELRRTLMPIAKKYDINEIMYSCAEYSRATGRRITYEYALISGVNDSDGCARELGRLIKGTLSHVNLIPLNEAKGYRKSARGGRFAEILTGMGIETTIRRGLGGDINGACGQLRWECEKEVKHDVGSGKD